MPINAPSADDYDPPPYFWQYLAEYSMHYRQIPLHLEVQFLCALAHGATGAWSLPNVSSMVWLMVIYAHLRTSDWNRTDEVSI